MRLFGAVREIRPELCQPPAPPTATAGDKWRLDEVFVRIQGVLHYLWRGVAKRHLLADVEHRQSRYLNNRAENSHRPTLRRERQMQRFKSSEQAQNFLSAHAFIHGHFHPRRHLLAADAYRALRSVAFDGRRRETCVGHAT